MDSAPTNAMCDEYPVPPSIDTRPADPPICEELASTYSVHAAAYTPAEPGFTRISNFIKNASFVQSLS